MTARTKQRWVAQSFWPRSFGCCCWRAQPYLEFAYLINECPTSWKIPELCRNWENQEACSDKLPGGICCYIHLDWCGFKVKKKKKRMEVSGLKIPSPNCITLGEDLFLGPSAHFPPFKSYLNRFSFSSACHCLSVLHDLSHVE